MGTLTSRAWRRHKSVAGLSHSPSHTKRELRAPLEIACGLAYGNFLQQGAWGGHNQFLEVPLIWSCA